MTRISLRMQRCLSRALLAMGLLMMMGTLGSLACAESENPTSFKHVLTQYIAALGDRSASSGNGAQFWGLWRQDPGPRGCRLDSYEKLKATGGVAPAQWKFDKKDWWLEEHGLIMEKPEIPIPPGKYVVTGGREATAVLTVHPKDKNGDQRWELDKGAKLYDVTHLPCRSARYKPVKRDNSCSPDEVQRTEFPVAPGAAMPSIKGCKKQDYSVLLVIGVAE